MASVNELLASHQRILRLTGSALLTTGVTKALSASDIVSLNIEEGVDGALLPGDVLSADATIRLRPDSWSAAEIAALTGAVITVSVGALDGQAWRDASFGSFIAEKVRRNENCGDLILTCSDSVGLKLASAWSDNVTYPASISTIWVAMLEQAGLTSSGTLPRGTQVISSGPDWNGVTLRRAMGELAAVQGCFLRIGRQGTLEIVKLWDTAVPVFALGTSAYWDLQYGGQAFGPMNRLLIETVRNGDEPSVTFSLRDDPSVPDSVLNTLTVSGNSLLSSGTAHLESVSGGMLDPLAGYATDDFEFVWRGDPSLCIGRRVALTDTSDTVRSGILCKQVFAFNSGFTAKCACRSPGGNAVAVRAITPQGDLNASRLIGTVDGGILSAHSVTAASIGAGAIVASAIAAGAVTADKLDASSVDAKIGNIADAHIASAEIDGAQIENATITSAKIADAAVTDAKIGTAAVTTAKINDAAITSAKIANGAITTALIDTGAVNTAQLADASITDAKIVGMTANKITAGTIDASVITVSNLSADNITTGTLNGQRIPVLGTEKLADGSVTASKVADSAISTDKLVANAVTAAKIASKTITANEIAANTITAAEIAASTITANEIAASTITANKLASNVGENLNLSSNTSITMVAGSCFRIADDGVRIATRKFMVDVADGDQMFHLDENGGTLNDLTVNSSFSAPNVARQYAGTASITVGTDSSTFLTLRQAFDSINNRVLDQNIEIYLESDLFETCTLKGITGYGCVTVHGADRILQGTIAIRNCACPVQIDHLQIRSAGAQTTVDAYGCTHLYISNSVIDGGGGTTALYARFGSAVHVHNSELYNAVNLLRSEYTSRICTYGLKGSGCTNFAYGEGGQFQMAGTRPDGQVCKDNATITQPDNLAALTVHTGSTQPAADPTFTAVFDASQTRTYGTGWISGSSLEQGIYSGITHYGCMWFQLGSLAGKVIRSVTLTIRRLSGSGPSGRVTLHLYGTSVTGASGNPTVNMADYGVIGTIGNGETVSIGIPPAAISSYASGAIGGFVLHPGDASVISGKQYSANFCDFNACGSSNAPRLEVTYSNYQGGGTLGTSQIGSFRLG